MLPSPGNGCIDNWRRNYGPDDISDWEEFMGDFVERYGATGKNQVRYWEIWNEPDLPEFLSKDPGNEDETGLHLQRVTQDRQASKFAVEIPKPESCWVGFLTSTDLVSLMTCWIYECGIDVRSDFDILAFHAFTAHDLKIFFLMTVPGRTRCR